MTAAPAFPFLDEIRPVATADSPLGKQVSDYLAMLAIPKGCLGQLHEVSRQLCLIQQRTRPEFVRGLVIVFAGDHGIALKGVSAFPRRATLENLKNMLDGRTVISAFAQTAGLEILYVDAGVDGPHLDPTLVASGRFIDARIADGTADCSEGAAMSRGQVINGLELGYRLAREACKTVDALVLGEMGIGNSSIASLVAGALLGLDATHVTGRGAGLNDDGLAKKKLILGQTLSRRKWRELDIVETLAELSGHEVNAMIGAMLGCASAGKPVLVDGFIASAAALAATVIEPASRGYMIPCTESAEFGYGKIAARLGFRPLLKLGLRLGEGSGAALAWPIVRSAAAYLSAVRSFDELGWQTKGTGDHSHL